MEIKQIKKKIIIFTDLDETLLKENKYNHNILNNFIKSLLKKKYEIPGFPGVSGRKKTIPGYSRSVVTMFFSY